jgi:hypothetical protein
MRVWQNPTLSANYTSTVTASCAYLFERVFQRRPDGRPKSPRYSLRSYAGDMLNMAY